MIHLLFLFYFVQSEWVGTLTLYPSNITYSNLARIDRGYELNKKYQICKEKNCVNKAAIFEFNSSTTFDSIAQSNCSLAIIIADKVKNPFKFALPMFSIRLNDSIGLLVDQSDILEIKYNFDFHCPELKYSAAVYFLCLIFWVLTILLWVYNNYKLNQIHAEVFHKCCTILLIFKLLNVIACLSEFAYCPTTRMSVEVLELFKKQTRSLYETSLFAYFLLLSKGCALIQSSIDRKEFNYLIIVVIFIYILDSAYNIVGDGVWALAIFLNAAVMLHSLFFGVGTLRQLNVQMEVIRETGMNMLMPVSQKKKSIFAYFLVLMVGYFAGEYLIHTYFFRYAITNFNEGKRLGLLYGAHESLEYVIIAGIYYLYRARDMGRFFGIEFENRPLFRRIVPFYESSFDCKEGMQLAVVMPRNRILLGKLE